MSNFLKNWDSRMRDRFFVRYWNKHEKKFEYHQIGTVCVNPFTDNTIYEPGQQCTGLRDKNKKPIYEGDIVRYSEYDNDVDCRAEWEYAEVVWGGDYDYPAFDLKDTDFDGTNGLSYIFGAGWTIEVCGNIYENPDILEGKR